MTGIEAVAGVLVLGVDTCGPSGTVALARIAAPDPPLLRKDGAPEGIGVVEVLGQMELAGRTFSSTLISSVEALLTGHGVGLRDVGAIVVVHGPGSFTGVRVGLSAVKGLAEPGQIPVMAVSRLAVLAAKAGVRSAALDAHRHEVFLRVESDEGVRELLAGAEEFSQISSSCGSARVIVAPVPRSEGPGAPGAVAVCDDAAAEMVGSAWGGAELRRVEAPTAADAVRLCAAGILASHPFGELRRMDRAPEILDRQLGAGRFVDLALLDGHYLRRSDAEIFGEAAQKPASEKRAGVRVRRMEAEDIDRVMEIAAATDHAPRWGRAAYEAVIDPGNQPRRVALVAERESGLAGFVVAAVLPVEKAELESIVTALPHQRRGVARELFASLKHELRRQGVREVMLEVRNGNHSAQGFYRFLGFKEEGRRPGYYGDPVEDAVLMRLSLR